MTLDVWGHVGYVVLIAGSALVAFKKPVGFSLRVLGSVIWALIGWQMQMPSIWLWSGLFAMVDLLGAVRAGRTS